VIRKPSIRVEIDKWDWSNGYITESVDITNSCVSYDFQKSIKSPTGQAVITTIPIIHGKPVLNLFQIKDVVRIYEFDILKFQGFIRSIGQNGVVGPDGKVTRRSIIQVGSFGSLFSETELGINMTLLNMGSSAARYYQASINLTQRFTRLFSASDNNFRNTKYSDMVSVLFDAWFQFLEAVGGSVFKKYKETGIFDKNEIYPYITEGIGEDFLPKNVDFSLIDHFEKVTDKDAAYMTRLIPREEGIFAGNSAGSAMQGLLQVKHMFGPNDVVVVIFHDHGTRYLGKMFNEDWMRDRGFIPSKTTKTASELIANHKELPLVSILDTMSCKEAFQLMQKYDISQIPVKNTQNEFVGSLDDNFFYKELLTNPDLMNSTVGSVMQQAYPVVSFGESIENISRLINEKNQACIVMDMGGNWHIITKQDLIRAIADV
jgi:predicted transcriptional regulator